MKHKLITYQKEIITDMKERLCIAYAADDNYAQYLGKSMLSLFESNKAFTSIEVFVLDCGIEDVNKDRIISIAKDFGRDVTFLSMDEYVSSLELNMGARKISIASYARLFLSSVIPQRFNKVLYLDCDTIILRELKDMWSIDVKLYMIAGVRDTVDKYFLKKIGLKQDDYYINCGIVLINLELWRKENLQEKFMDFIKKHNGNVPHHDQGTINAICNKGKLIIAAKYNVTSNFYTFSSKTIKKIYSMKDYYSQKDLDEARKNPVILHFTTGLVGRPWEENCSHPMKEEYLRVSSQSPWNKEALLPDSRSPQVKAFAAFYKYSPIFLSILAYRLSNWFFHLKD